MVRNKLFARAANGLSTRLITLTLAAIFLSAVTVADTVFVSPLEQVRVVELYTSEGCSSCPPADRWFSRFKQHPQLWRSVVPMAFHVDYWDYIGWTDRFAEAQYGVRQRTHEQQGNIRQVYTPGVVVTGQEWRGWHRNAPLEKPLFKKPGVLTLTLDAEGFSAHFAAKNYQQALPNLTIALLGFNLTTPVRAGENKGELLQHDFVVLATQRYTVDGNQWQGQLPTIDPKFINSHDGQGEHGLALAAWVHTDSNIKPVQAVGGWLQP